MQNINLDDFLTEGIGPLTPAGQEEIKVKDVADIVAENLS